ncbi:MAG: EVE domain-containing protein [Polyangia bacterium]
MAKQAARRPRTFLVKSEPYKFSFADLVRDGRAVWDGVRNFEARNNLRAMRPGDLLLFYHSNEGKEIVGIAEVTKAAYPDPTAPGEDWSVVDVAPRCALREPVTLATIKATPALAEMQLLRRSRLSVVPVTAAEFTRILKLGKTPLEPTAASGKAPKRERPQAPA